VAELTWGVSVEFGKTTGAVVGVGDDLEQAAMMNPVKIKDKKMTSFLFLIVGCLTFVKNYITFNPFCLNILYFELNPCVLVLDICLKNILYGYSLSKAREDGAFQVRI
jgi:hypothetical protein